MAFRLFSIILVLCSPKSSINDFLYEGQFELYFVYIYTNPFEGRTQMFQLKDLIINTVRFIYIYDLRVCLSSAFSSGNMQNE